MAYKYIKWLSERTPSELPEVPLKVIYLRISVEESIKLLISVIKCFPIT